jgi:hypothetical protein
MQEDTETDWLATEPQRAAPPRQLQLTPPCAAEFVICDHTIEALFKDLKRDGWQWQATKMTDAGRAERLWLALAVATLWVVSVGGAGEGPQPTSGVVAVSPRCPRRQVSCFERGRLRLLQAALRGVPLPLGQLVPEPWAARRGTSLTAYYYHRRRQQQAPPHTYP